MLGRTNASGLTAIGTSECTGEPRKPALHFTLHSSALGIPLFVVAAEQQRPNLTVVGRVRDHHFVRANFDDEIVLPLSGVEPRKIGVLGPCDNTPKELSR
ncbi:hypothetical protein [Haladaptatus sp. DFWS20]|uniref:hypothetical protein n=1 Tax=Haladaptatus sp. DFWS20 TaxID=3403467 RepID=UPI003EB848DE